VFLEDVNELSEKKGVLEVVFILIFR